MQTRTWFTVLERTFLAKSLRSKRHRALMTVLVASRKEAGMTQQQLAEKLKRQASWVSRVETGERRCDVVEFVSVAEALKVDPAVLFDRFLHWAK